MIVWLDPLSLEVCVVWVVVVVVVLLLLSWLELLLEGEVLEGEVLEPELLG